MSADTTPISPARFASAIKDLSLSMLHLKVLEIRNSIAHLQYSNDQLAPFAQGTSVALGSSSTTTTTESSSSSASNNNSVDATATTTAPPDQDCIDAIKENEAVIDRMAERIAIIRAEVEERGCSWTEFQSQDEVEANNNDNTNHQTTTTTTTTTTAAAAAATTNGEGLPNGQGGQAGAEELPPPRHSAWTDGTFQTGTISNGQVRFDSQPGAQTNHDGAQSSSTTTRGQGQEESGDGAADDGGLHL
ncbi:hypothetical protein BBK36DRAFT_1116368 [Trichoderma citrinoviride]|uniref:Uncharacterized protein n=1 Tax=Trichoderma citrinoviride TaxID=58853 RepID=A0A2T4BD96_9HYPO|nr:hypothetical protein BBK36DRAFT_1116368 [Trichoderma citrinoviride]PTB67285.1 hypothetical protein BBK36DRAFT_1116368 [Trichoderma citrinoviride]